MLLSSPEGRRLPKGGVSLAGAIGGRAQIERGHPAGAIVRGDRARPVHHVGHIVSLACAKAAAARGTAATRTAARTGSAATHRLPG